MNDSLQSKTIQWMRFPLAAAIVFLHCSSAVCEENIVYTFIRQYVSGTLAGTAVSVFFIISGFLFFHNVDNFTREVYLMKIKNRAKSLFLPYFLWNLICAFIPLLILLLIVIKNHEPLSWFSDYLENLNGWHIFWDYSKWGDSGATGPIDLPLWFVRNLMIIVLCSPLTYYLLKN